MMKKATAVVDFGTSKVLVLLAEESAYQKVTITSAGMAQYDGFMNGEWNAPGEVSDAIASALEAAENKVGTHIKEVYVGVPGEFVRVYVIESSVALQGADPKVTSADVEKLQRQATEMLDRPTGVIIHRSPAWFKVDGGQKTLEPVDLKGSTLEGMIGFVLADQFFINDVTERLKELGVEVRGFFSTSVGEAMQMIPFEERDHTAILVDVGYLSTEVMAVEGDALIWQKVLPVGGAHITLDLTYGLEKPFDMCEKIKRSYTFNAPKNTQIEVQGENGQLESFSGEQVSMIVDARVDEMLEMVDDAIKKSGIRLGNWSNVYFTGGGLMPMSGARVYAAGKLSRNVREATAKTVKLKPAQVYASGSGLLELVYNTIEMEEQEEGLLGRIRRIFGK
ncbi:MAG: cell division FtsA domain-containing protein [Clostridiales bacterium]|nr:cell division FtsA domain-containing protein [Clostridiales bacterium]MDY5349547.1 cell division FtsA domain-containing protein [Candidatus Ventricola sp.]MDY5513632.1 cell division FtsA domain-containing protein [Candidatus Ventricola sp.]